MCPQDYYYLQTWRKHIQEHTILIESVFTSTDIQVPWTSLNLLKTI